MSLVADVEGEIVGHILFSRLPMITELGTVDAVANAIYDSLEVGLSAHSFGPDEATLFVDDIVISENPVN